MLLALVGCSADGASEEGLSEVLPPPECASLWADDAAAAFSDLLARATSPSGRTWTGFGPADGVVVLDAGTSETGRSCLGAWRTGAVISYAAVGEPPTLLTPLYGYYLSLPGSGGQMDALATAATQPECIRAWLEGQGVSNAVLMPVDAAGLPFGPVGATEGAAGDP